METAMRKAKELLKNSNDGTADMKLRQLEDLLASWEEEAEKTPVESEEEFDVPSLLIDFGDGTENYPRLEEVPRASLISEGTSIHESEATFTSERSSIRTSGMIRFVSRMF